ncbi:MAG: helicase-related protein, partial [Candidatus Uhrbacteria bacterium]
SKMAAAIRAAIAAGQQVFVVCPKIEVAEEGTAAAIEVAERAERAFPGARVGLLHGRLPSTEQRQIMEAFAARQIDILVATTVVEVGIDQPNATIMIVEDADRFGLAQLHQLRGRVGRGDVPGHCYLTTRSVDPTVVARLEKVARTVDGFALAELDLRERGPGAVVGTEQSGWPAFHFATRYPDIFARVEALGAALDRIQSVAPDMAVHLE